MKLKKIVIQNFRSIISDEVIFNDFTFFVGKNNYGKSNYLRAIDHLLSFSKTYGNIKEIQNDKSNSIIIEGWFEGVKKYTPQLKDSKHKDAVEKLIDSDNLIQLRLTINTDGQAETLLVDPSSAKTVNPTGWATNCKKLFPETIFVPATADTADELQEKASTALSKIKKEVMQQFFTSLSSKIETAFEPIDKFLHGEEKDRSEDLKNLEKDFSEEMMGEFSSTKPSIKFTLPDSSFIGKGMKINLHDGFHECDIEQKGHGLQRTALFALIRLLSKHNTSNQSKPAPIFLIEELEAFLHPSAQKRLAESMEKMAGKYQTIATTHSPFVLTEKLLGGYRKIFRNDKEGSKCCGPQKNYDEFRKKDYDVVKNSLSHTGNLISLFSDIVVIVEGKEDSGFYPTVLELLKKEEKGLVSFVGTVGGGNSNFHVSYNFFKLMGFKKVSIICDLDCLFDMNFKELLKTVSIDSEFIDGFRSDIGFSGTGQPGTEFVLSNIGKIDDKKLTGKINELAKVNIFVLKNGTPENYYSEKFKNNNSAKNVKKIWEYLTSKEDLKSISDLEGIMNQISNS